MIGAFALAAIPGVIVLEILEYGRPRTRERNGARAFAGYLIISLFAWIAAVLFLDGDSHLAAVIDSADESGRRQVDAYMALGWRLLAASLIAGCLLRGLSAGLLHLAYEVEEGKRLDASARLPWPGAIARRFIAMPFAWDRLLERLRRSSKTQVVHVQFKDGEELYGVLAAEGHADTRRMVVVWFWTSSWQRGMENLSPCLAAAVFSSQPRPWRALLSSSR